MISRFRYVLKMALLLGVTSCSPQQGQQGSVSLTLPESLQEKIDAAATGNLKACFGVSIDAPDITSVSPSSCDHSYGLFSGVVRLGQPISLEVPYGSDRRIRIYYILSEQSCQKFDISQGLANTFGSDRVFLISEASKIQINQPDMSLEMEVQWPSTKNSLATLLSAPASCQKGQPILSSQVPQARIVSGSAKGTTANGSQMHVRIYNQRVQLKTPKINESQLGPAFLGEVQ